MDLIHIPKREPFKNSELLAVLGESAKRSRQVFLVLLFAAALVLITLVNTFSTGYNWYLAKVKLYQTMLDYFIFPGDPARSDTARSDTARWVNSLSQYVLENEKKNFAPDSLALALAHTYQDNKYRLNPHIKLKNPTISGALISDNLEERKEEYNEIADAICFSERTHTFSRTVAFNELYFLQGGAIEHIESVKVPILGVTFHANLLGTYGGIIILILYIILNYCLLNEYSNTIITFRNYMKDGTHHLYYFYEFTSMQQVLFRPNKLFRSRHPNILKRYHFFSTGMLAPLLIYIVLVIYDICTYTLALAINKQFSPIVMSIEGLLLILILFHYIKSHRRSKKIDSLWLNISLELNLEFILTKIGIGQKTAFKEFIEFKENNLSEDDAAMIKLFWFKIVKKTKFLPLWWNGCNIVIAKRMYRRFISCSLDIDTVHKKLNKPGYRKIIPQKDEIEECWDVLEALYNENDDKKVYRRFNEVFMNAIVRYKKEVNIVFKHAKLINV